ncbi:MAG TPA: hypothetical protein PKX92_14180 [Edaphocola sp.]|nr:hypothetical protein [Edaphocola sp.]
MKKIYFIIIPITFFIFLTEDVISQKSVIIYPRNDGYYVNELLVKNNKNSIEKNINFFKLNTFFFFEDNSVMFVNLGIVDTDSANFMNLTQRVLLKKFYGISWGKYEIIGDKISANFCFQFFVRGLRMKYFKTFFEGTISDDHTITNWTMVAPYPKVNKRLNENFEDLKIPKTLKFLPNEGVKAIQSENAWINKVGN